MASSFITQSGYVHLETLPLSIHNEQDDVFKYELVYLRYLEDCENYFKNSLSITGPWTLAARKYIVDSIKENEQVLMLLNPEYNFEPNVLEKYQIVLEDGVEKLVLTGTSIEVLPYEECFDIFVELHNKTGHGDFDVVLKNLENIFLVNDTCLNIFLSNCNVCKRVKLQNTEPVVFNDCVSVTILKAPIQDKESRFILFYVDKVTNFMLFRPLIAMDEYEISIEILKIFTDFGPPIVIKTIHAPLLNSVLTILERAGFNYDISIHASDQVDNESYYFMEQIVARTNDDSTYWSTICRFVQFKHNNGLLPTFDPVSNKTVQTSIKPLNKLFYTKHSTINHSVSKQTLMQNKIKNTSSNLKTSTYDESVRHVEECVINLETSETDTASEIEDVQSIRAMDLEEKLKLWENVEPDDQTSRSPSPDKMEFEDSNEIKIEYNPIQTVSARITEVTNLSSYVQPSVVPETDSVHAFEGETGAPLIVNSIPVKYEPVLDESLIARSSTDITEDIPTPIAETLTQYDVSLETAHNSNRKHDIDKKEDKNSCAVCNGKMLTDYFCFNCKKKNHIFCMKRVTSSLEKVTDVVTCFIYCHRCLKIKYNLSNAVKFN